MYKGIKPNQKECWIKKGYSEEEAVSKVSERQTTFSKEICMEKYGKEEGLKRWKQRQKKWQETMKSKPEGEIVDINRRKMFKILIHRFLKNYFVRYLKILKRILIRMIFSLLLLIEIKVK